MRTCAALADALLFTTSPLLMNDADRAAFGQVENKVKLSRYGGDCYAYCMLAAGQIDLVIETEIKPHDIVPLIPIITGAGGIVTTWENGPAQAGGRIVVAGDARVHAGGAGDAARANTAACRARRRRTPPRTGRDIDPAPARSRAWLPARMRCRPASRCMPNSSIAGVETTSSRPAATSNIGWRIWPA